MATQKITGNLNVTGDILKNGTPIEGGLKLYRHALDFSYAENPIVAITPRSTPYTSPVGIANEAILLTVGDYKGLDLYAVEDESGSITWTSVYLLQGAIQKEAMDDGSMFTDTVSPF